MTTQGRAAPCLCALIIVLMLASIPAAAAPRYLGGEPEFRAAIESPDKLLPGTATTLVIHLENRGGDPQVIVSPPGSTGPPPSTAIGVTATLDAGEAPLALKTGRQMVGSLASGEGVRIPFALTVMPGATGGDYELPLTLFYTRLSSEEQVDSGSVIYHYAEETALVPVLVRIDDVVRIAVTDVSAGSLTPGGEGTLALGIENTGSLEGTGAVARIRRADGSPVIPVTGTVYIGTFSPGAVHECRFKVRIDDTAGAGTYPLEIAVDYRGRSGEPLASEPETVGIPVAGKITFGTHSGTPLVYRGSRAPVDITFENTGPATVYSAQARISAVEPFTGYRDTAKLGDLAPGEQASARFEIGVGKAATLKDYGLDAEIRYRDEEGQDRISDPLTVSITVGERPGLLRIFSDPLILSVIVALAIGIGYYLKVYRNNRDDRPEE